MELIVDDNTKLFEQREGCINIDGQPVHCTLSDLEFKALGRHNKKFTYANGEITHKKTGEPFSLKFVNVQHDEFKLVMDHVSLAKLCDPSFNYDEIGGDREKFCDVVAERILTIPIIEKMFKNEDGDSVLTSISKTHKYWCDNIYNQMSDQRPVRKILWAFSFGERRWPWFATIAAVHDLSPDFLGTLISYANKNLRPVDVQSFKQMRKWGNILHHKLGGN